MASPATTHCGLVKVHPARSVAVVDRIKVSNPSHRFSRGISDHVAATVSAAFTDVFLSDASISMDFRGAVAVSAAKTALPGPKINSTLSVKSVKMRDCFAQILLTRVSRNARFFANLLRCWDIRTKEPPNCQTAVASCLKTLLFLVDRGFT